MKIYLDIHIDTKKGETITVVKKGKWTAEAVVTLHTLLESKEITSEEATEKLNLGNFTSTLNTLNLEINL